METLKKIYILLSMIGLILISGCSMQPPGVSMSSNYINVTASSVNLTLPNPLNVTVKNTQLKIYGNTNTTILNPQRAVNITNFPTTTGIIFKNSNLINSTFTANGQTIVFTNNNNNSNINFIIQPSNTYGAVTIQFEISQDNNKWASTNCAPTNAQTILTNTGSVTNVTTAYNCKITGFQYFRLRVSAWTSGTVRVYMKGSNSNIDPTVSVGTVPVTKSGTWSNDGSTAGTYINTIDKQHSNLENGRGWEFNDVVSLASGANVTFSMNVTGTANRQPHFYFASSGEQTINCTFWEAPTSTGGTVQTQRQRNRNTGSTLSPSMYIYKGVYASAKGSLLYNYIAFASGSNHNTGSSNRDLNEWVLKTSTKYLLICKNAGSSSGLFNIVMEYYYTA